MFPPQGVWSISEKSSGQIMPEEWQHYQIPWILTFHLLPGIFQSSFASPQQGPLSL